MSEAAYELTADPTAQRELDALTEDIQARFRSVLDDMATTRNPAAPRAVKPLDDRKGLMRVRVGRYRAIVGRSGAQLVLLAVGHRDNFYDDKLAVAEARFDGGGG